MWSALQFIEMQAAPKVPHRGIGMWTFPVKDVNEIKNRAYAKKVKILFEAQGYESPIFGKCHVMTMLAPNGFMIEVFKPI